MTDQLPYSTKASDNSIIHAIHQSELPAAVPPIIAPDYILAILDGCWELTPDSRSSMTSYVQALTTKPTRPFSYFTKLPFSRVPSIVKTEVGEVQFIHNLDPEIKLSCDVEFTTTYPESLLGYSWLPR